MMYRQLLNPSEWLLLVLICTWQPVTALSTDADHPIEIEADSAELDDVKNISIYRGNVVVVQGSIRMTGDKMTVYQTAEDDLDLIIMRGRPATYRQLPDNSKVYDEAEALTMEYYEIKQLVILIKEALVTQEDSRLSGERIEYDTNLSKVKAWSNPTKDQQIAPTSTDSSKKKRVKIIIKRKKDKQQGP